MTRRPTERQARARLADELWRQIRPFAPIAELRRIKGLLDIWAMRAAAECAPDQSAGPPGIPPVFLPGLPTSAWLSPRDFGFASLLREHADAMRDELARHLAARGAFTPYSRDLLPDTWQTIFIMRRNRLLPRRAGVFDETRRLARTIAAATGYVEQFQLLRLAPRSQLIPHADYPNYLATVQFGLIVPGRCGYRVAGRARPLRADCALAFDNTFEHTAWNGGDRDRITVCAHTFHPALTAVERRVLATLHPHLVSPPAQNAAR